MPQPGPQTVAVSKHWVDEIFFGGAVGGGKSDFLLGDFAQDVPNYGAAWRGILFRRTYPQLEELITRSKEIFPSWFPGTSWQEGAKTWQFANGATLKMRFLERKDDWMQYWGHAYSWIGWDELPNWPELGPYHKMKSRLRSAAAIPNKRIRSTGNPGGPGHLGVKQYFQIDVYPLGGQLIHDPESGMRRMFIRSRLQDNQILLASDPGYVNRLNGVGSKMLVKALKDGDWNVVAGAFFDDWDENRHVCRPFAVPHDWLHFRAADWGSARPFAIYWIAVASEDTPLSNGCTLPRGGLVVYREYYGMRPGQLNEGLKLPPETVARQIAEAEKDEKISYGVLDPAAFASDGGPSIAERMATVTKANKKGAIVFNRADNKRVSECGAMGGWDMLRFRLIGEAEDRPMLVIFSPCEHLIRTLPALQHDANHYEDVDSNLEDHAPDAIRYGAMSRPWTPKEYKPKIPLRGTLDPNTATLDQLWAEHDAQQRRTRVI